MVARLLSNAMFRKPDIAVVRRLAQTELSPYLGGIITSDMSLSQVNALQGAKAVLKKFKDLEDEQAGARAVEKFLECNDACGSFELKPESLFDEELIEGVKSLLDDWLHPDGVPIGLSEIFDHTTLGAGKSIKAEETDFYSKLFNSTLSTQNPDLYVLYCTAITRNPTWAQAEAARDSMYGRLVVDAGSLSTVPKEFGIRRTIISEGVLDGLFQQGIRGVLESILRKRVGISLSAQPDLNREAARRGSINGSDATIDLRSASDLIARFGLCHRILPRYFVTWLDRCRGHSVRLPSGEIRELHMMSSMGNAFTFPLQTMIFSAIVITCYRLLGIKVVKPRPPSERPFGLVPEMGKLQGSSEPGSFGVFGDDIVVRREAYEYVCHALELFGFRVNVDKSFNSGDFRESCGKDYWRGHLVRGIYIKSLASRSDCYSAINRLIRWSARTGIKLHFLISYLWSCVDTVYIPAHDGDGEGIKAPLSLASPDFYDFHTRIPIYRAWVVKAESWRVPTEDGVTFHGLPRSFRYNGAGLTIALVTGCLRDGRIGRRLNDDQPKRSKVQQRRTPFWDNLLAEDYEGLRDGTWQGAVADYASWCSRPIE
jgi:hypothetical protein